MQIRNKRLDYVHGVHATTIEVSSTDSPMYWNTKKNDYATRASFEALKYVGVDGKKGGTLIFVLLTYNKEHLPMFPNSSVPCFNMRHVSTLVKALKDKYGRTTFSYLVGAEYGTDEKHQKLPHYHCLFMLDSSIRPRDFMEHIRKVWTGVCYYQNSKGPQSWKYGNLGYVFPAPWDCDKADALRGKTKEPYRHDYVAIDNGACATYAAKYATKSLGFFRDGAVKREVAKYERHSIASMLPRCLTSHKFGFGMIKEDTFDAVRSKVYDPLRQKEVNIPPYILQCYLYKRVFRGRTKEIVTYGDFDVKACEKACREEYEIQGYIPPIVYQRYKDFNLYKFRKIEDIKVRKLYDLELLSHGYEIKIARFLQNIERNTIRVFGQYGCTMEYARYYVIWSKLYRHLPFYWVERIVGRHFFTMQDLFSEKNIVRVYLFAFLYRKIDTPINKNTSFIDYISQPLYDWFYSVDFCEQIRRENILHNEYNMALDVQKNLMAKALLRHGSYDSSLTLDVEKPSTHRKDYFNYVKILDSTK